MRWAQWAASSRGAPWKRRNVCLRATSTLSNLSLAEASELVRARKVSPLELTRACLARIEALDPKLNAFITVTAESALAAARAAEEEIGRGSWKGPLHGIPIALKDLVDTRGVRTTAGSNVYKDRVPAEDAEIVRRLEAAGAVLARQAEPARVRVRRQHGRERLRPRAQPVVARALGGWLVGGLGRRRRRRPVLRRDRLRHGRLDPPARRVLRHRRPQADATAA